MSEKKLTVTEVREWCGHHHHVHLGGCWHAYLPVGYKPERKCTDKHCPIIAGLKKMEG